MKKLLAICTLALAGVASAAGPTVGLVYDYDRANGSAFGSAQEARLGIAQETRLGTFDANLAKLRFKGATQDDVHGYEIGYGNKYSFGRVGLAGRVAYGRVNNVDPNGGGFTGSTNYGSFGLEASTPVHKQVNAFVGYRHRNAFSDDMAVQNRYTVGADIALNKQVALRAGLAHTRQGGLSYNGFTTGLSYSF